MKNNTEFKKVFKVFVIGFILISSIYVLYFYNNVNTNVNNNNVNNNVILENFVSSSDCSNCKINPSSNNCKPIYNINYTWDSRNKTFDISNVLTDYIFCEWEPNCSYNNMGNNILTQQERLRLSNEDFL
jgi:hypothetical protein